MFRFQNFALVPRREKENVFRTCLRRGEIRNDHPPKVGFGYGLLTVKFMLVTSSIDCVSFSDRLPMFHVDTISAILDFFSELCWEGPIRKWLGSSEVSVFWEHLLEYLCKTVPSSYTLR